MMRVRLAAVGAALLWCHAATGQVPSPRSRDYLFAHEPLDARAVWVNPGGLAATAQASLIGEVTLGRRPTDDWRVTQYSMGLSSRGAALGYRRDRFGTGDDIGTWSLAGGAGLGALAIGLGLDFQPSRRSYHVGFRYTPMRRVDLAGVVRNIGRPMVRDSTLRVTLVGSMGLSPVPALRLAGEARAIERRPAPGYDVTYRAGAELLLPGSWALRALTRLDFDPNLRMTQWSAGVAIGGVSQLLGVTSGPANTGSGTHIEAFSVTALSKRLLP